MRFVIAETSSNRSELGDVVREPKSKPVPNKVTSIIRNKGKSKAKVVPVLNEASRYEDVLGQWRYGSTHS
jgi:hypothetical protein